VSCRHSRRQAARHSPSAPPRKLRDCKLSRDQHNKRAERVCVMYGINDCGPTDGLHTRDPCRPGNAMTVCRFRNRCCLAEAKHASHGARDTAFYVRRTGVTRRIYRPSTHSPLIDRLGDGRRTSLDIGDAGTMQGLRMSAGRFARDNQPVGPPQFLLDRVKQFRRSAVVHDWDARMRNRHGNGRFFLVVVHGAPSVRGFEPIRGLDSQHPPTSLSGGLKGICESPQMRAIVPAGVDIAA
jgi:hypothetical protein